MLSLPTPKRCIPSVTKKSLLLHLLAFLWCCFGTYHDIYHYHSPNFDSYGGRFQFFTMITAYVCLAAYGFAFLVDLIQVVTGGLEVTKITKSGYQEHNSLLISLRDELISCWVTKMSLSVVMLFWGIAAIDVEGIHPTEHQKLVPLFGWFNHYLHTIPAPVNLLLVTNVNYQYGSLSRSLVSILVLGISYVSWMVHLARVNGVWAYPFIEQQTQGEFAVFIVFAHVLFFVAYLMGRSMAALVWNDECKQKTLAIARKNV